MTLVEILFLDNAALLIKVGLYLIEQSRNGKCFSFHLFVDLITEKDLFNGLDLPFELLILLDENYFIGEMEVFGFSLALFGAFMGGEIKEAFFFDHFRGRR
jgi:hypothetical protein